MNVRSHSQPAVAETGRRELGAVRLRFNLEVELLPSVMLSLLPALVSTRVSLELALHDGEVMILVVADARELERISGLLESALPGSGAAEEDLPRASAPFLGWQLETRLADSLPLQANLDAGFDLLAALANLLAVHEETRAIFQIVLQPARAKAWRGRAVRDAHRLTVAEPSLGERLVGLALGAPNRKTQLQVPRWVRSFQEATYEKSAAQVLVHASVRFAVQAGSRDATANLAKQALGLACASFTNGANTLVPVRLASQEAFEHEFNSRLPGRGIVATPAEVAVLWHPPTRSAHGVVGLWASGKRVRSPREARQGDLRIGRDIQGHDIFLYQTDRLTHAALIGASGSGKTTLMINMALADAEKGDGFALLDPKGGAIAELIARLPASRLRDVVVLNPADENGRSFNPLSKRRGTSAHQLAEEVVGCLRRLFGEAWGPRLERVIYMAVLAVVLGRDDPNLMEVYALLTQSAFRAQVLRNVDDEFALGFWRDEFDALSPSVRAQWVQPALNRLSAFLGNPLVRRVIGGGAGIDLGVMMQESGILLAALAPSEIGDDNSHVIANLLLASFYREAMARVEQPQVESHDFTLFVDEAHTAAPVNLVQMLSQARAGHLRVCLVSQFFHQLPPQVVDAVLANVSTLVAFRLGERDAHLLEDRFKPEFKGVDLMNADNHVAAVRIVSQGQVLPPFSLVTDPLPPSKGELWSRQVREAASRREDGPSVRQEASVQILRPIPDVVEVEWNEA
jgi:Type IV secretion-system coupling protein DNA-binding domain